MSDEHNPLIPAGYDIAWAVISAMVVVLTVVALISLARSAKGLTDWQCVVWVALILLVPVIGPISWLAIGGRPHAAARADEAPRRAVVERADMEVSNGT